MNKENDSSRKKIIRKVTVLFLVVLLALTFFSNTIMNYSLPEVATTIVNQGSVSNKVRVQGDVEMNSDYEVTVSGTRVIKEVLVEAGDTVKAGQTLFTFEEGENRDLEEAKQTLDEMELNYAKSLLTMAPDYEEDNIAIKEAREDLDKAVKAQEKAKKNDANVKKAKKEESQAKKKVNTQKAKVDSQQEKVDNQQKKVDKLQEQIEAYAEIGDYKTVSDQIAADEKLLATEKTALNDLKEDLKKLEEDAEGNADAITAMKRQIRDKEASIKEMENNIAASKKLLESLAGTVTLKETLKQEKATLSAYQTTLADEQKKLAKYQEELTTKTEKVTELTTEGTLEDANAAVKEKQKALDSMIRALEGKKGQDALSEQGASMDRQKAQENIEKQRQKVKDMENSSDIAEVKAKEDGLVSTVDCKVGDTVAADTPIARVQLTSSGYVVKTTVTQAQAKLLHTDDEARIENIWDDGVSATVRSIKADPSNPNQNMIVTFAVQGDVIPGSTLQLMVGEKSAFYETIVPNNAIREDSKGSFVLVVNVKGTPLGNRYKIERVSVEVLASDEQNSAVSGAIQAYENVVTNSSKPLEDGTQVRLADE